ncbi:MAG: hypothetical protein CFE23_12655 [Flavobacterium sp. BFFFF1]|uniref:hypothetical protein n=1 Tax=unclassified Flavobacterium TaxID=196869 RepID=UPI000BCE10C4|nr:MULTISPECIES: hypothetical protein [unclassified Flavobacterium]OYU79749.1 MAG: hypothetical protein CFE23_12655 [Flavobacterium sp. BFFFF1]
MEKVNMDSLVTILAEVEKMGFRSQFEINGRNLVSLKTGSHFVPEEITIVHFYRFEGESNPDDSAIMYAIETCDQEKGTLVDGYGTAADPETAAFMLKVKDVHK